ncbi:hypothetical protein L873DRAFT_490702 [Choiromyces venosus 120613-1]|uniref:Uncharacterized protein n=1 Tax=Choiromyces venosus 120613-1 TaxID=1336337 RepID=A0A3N4JUY3_9PEZI|nr:hypothetical protein L873DRAFT_490702 [Choiromyces venosus 120613-1]
MGVLDDKLIRKLTVLPYTQYPQYSLGYHSLVGVTLLLAQQSQLSVLLVEGHLSLHSYGNRTSKVTKMRGKLVVPLFGIQYLNRTSHSPIAIYYIASYYLTTPVMPV